MPPLCSQRPGVVTGGAPDLGATLLHSCVVGLVVGARELRDTDAAAPAPSGLALCSSEPAALLPLAAAESPPLLWRETRPRSLGLGLARDGP